MDGRLVQRVLHRFGRLDQLQASGQLDTLVLSLGRFAENVVVLDALAKGETLPTETLAIGPGLIFDRLWEEAGLRDVLRAEGATRRFGFDLERAVFLTVLHRLMAPGSDRAAERWQQDYRLPGTGALSLHHLYRAMTWLGAARQPREQTGATPWGPRTQKDRLEEALVARRRDLFNQQLQLVFFDTTSIDFEGAGGERIGQYGHSKDHRPDVRQMVVGLVLDLDGWPVCSEFWPGHTTDVTTLVPIVERLQHVFQVRDVCVVADRGMISDRTIADLEDRGWFYILGVRMRRSHEARAVVADAERFTTVSGPRTHTHDAAPLAVKTVVLDDRRYVVCRNEEQARKDAHDRAAIVESPGTALTRGDKAVVGNKGVPRFLTTHGPHVTIDEAAIVDEAQFDGPWALRTNTTLAARDVAMAYTQRWAVDASFRAMNSTLETRPIDHQRDDTIRGHVFCSFLALLLQQEAQRRLTAKGWRLEWAHIVRDLDQLHETAITLEDRQYVIRSQAKGTVGKVFQACGVALPPSLRPVPAPASTRSETA